MTGRVAAILWAWAGLSPFLFRFLPGRDAAIACLVAGWAFLPVAPYPPTAIDKSGKASSFHALAVPTELVVNKATAIGLGALAGLALFDRRAFGRLRFDRVDLPMVAWCLVPLASAASNGLPISEGLAQARYLGLAWGVPYALGRAYLVDDESRRRFALGLAAGGLAYLPICALEVVAGPTAYRLAYGPHPYEFEGAARFLGHRPLGFLEHGNQLGIWMAGSALAATWLWASGPKRRPFGIPGGVVAAVLVGATLLCQSHGSILLMGVGLAPLLLGRAWRGRRPWRWAAVVVLGLGLLAAGLVLAGLVQDAGSLRQGVGDFFKGIGKSSFTWRLSRSGEFLPVALRRPFLGWGRADWRGDGRPFVNPVNLSGWLLALGMYGLVGLSALTAAWLLPLGRSMCPGPLRTRPDGAAAALMALVAVNWLDGFSNSVVIIPILAAVGGLNRPAGRANPAP